MKVAILSSSANHYGKPFSEGLQRMFAQIGVDATVFYRGLAAVRSTQRLVASDATPRGRLKHLWRTAAFLPFMARLRAYDLIVLIGSPPTAFMHGFMRDRALRRLKPNTPIVLYTDIFLPLAGEWEQWLRDGNPAMKVPEGGQWGLERYDWHLVGTTSSNEALPRREYPFTHVGVNLDDGSLRVEPKPGFVALLDFATPGFEAERALQVAALEETDTPYVELKGRYTISEIRAVYRSVSIYFLATPESFGFPICEVQGCGAYVFTPWVEWCSGHYLDKDIHAAGPGELSPNFVVYGHDKTRLVAEIQRVKANYSAQQVFDTFMRYQPHLFRGRPDALAEFVAMAQDGRIHSRLHRSFRALGEASSGDAALARGAASS